MQIKFLTDSRWRIFGRLTDGVFSAQDRACGFSPTVPPHHERS